MFRNHIHDPASAFGPQQWRRYSQNRRPASVSSATGGGSLPPVGRHRMPRHVATFGDFSDQAVAYIGDGPSTKGDKHDAAVATIAADGAARCARAAGFAVGAVADGGGGGGG